MGDRVRVQFPLPDINQPATQRQLGPPSLPRSVNEYQLHESVYGENINVTLIDNLERLLSEMTCCLLSGTLNCTR